VRGSNIKWTGECKDKNWTELALKLNNHCGAICQQSPALHHAGNQSNLLTEKIGTTEKWRESGDIIFKMGNRDTFTVMLCGSQAVPARPSTKGRLKRR
jgi:hypothetical protein